MSKFSRKKKEYFPRTEYQVSAHHATLKSSFVWLLFALFILVLDQYSKFLVGTYFLPEISYPVTSYFNIFFIYNTGAAFSILEKANGWQEWLFGGIASVVGLMIILWLFRSPPGRVLTKLSLMLILSGAIGNLIDRIAYGHVRDFLDFYWHNWHWPAFNIADSAICIGAILLIIELFRREHRK
ncbi:MAG: signal peptidase II [Gammaproteobacteria bacterium]